MKMKYESSPAHRKNLKRGLTVGTIHVFVWSEDDGGWEVVEYSNGECWMFRDVTATPVRKVGERLMFEMEDGTLITDYLIG